ncbi:serine hydrolase domain-containing protein [Kitasatospora viridis]|uniref:D-alanyl-D-alanine carboxypeptidase n=1 Tax=Kitasatospora viridis TaxID=281105 RepID=A0A561TTW4_9ACTN|nr:serine hydrolase domain-containing protein [Kitasatospora viridis]TWF90571.1 D-alanyl-D-alanine carboxypeptidase [Kitasatospora viridis]
MPDVSDELPSLELLPQTRRALLHRVAVGQADGRAPSLIGAVLRGGQLVWSGARSMIEGHAPDANVQFRIGSITKTFTAVLVLRLRDEGLLDLADPLEQHLPGTAAGRATVRELLGHSAGLTAEPPGPWWERAHWAARPEPGELLEEQPFRYPAGERFRYSNPGYALLGALVERLRGEPWAEVLRQELLEPLGMTRTTLLPQAPHAGGFAVHPWADVMMPEPLTDTGPMAPAGQLWSTAADLIRFAAFLCGGNEKVLAPETLAEMRRPAVAPEGDWTSCYGLGLQLRREHGRLLFGHAGSVPGFLAGLWVCEEEDVAAVALTNTTSGAAAGTVAADLVRIVAEQEPRFPEPWRPVIEVAPELLAATGPWFWGPAPLTLHLLSCGELELREAGRAGGRTRFQREADGSWTAQDGYFAGEPLRMVPAVDGSLSHLDLGGLVLTRQPYGPAGVVPGGLDPKGWHLG